MGVPIPFPCAAKDCEEVRGVRSAGVFFGAQQLFIRSLGDPPQLWACCVEHKKEALHDILVDLPFRHHKAEQERRPA